MLGGTYEKPSFSSDLAIYKAKKEKKMREKDRLRRLERRTLNSVLISVYREYVDRSEPLSAVWCDCYNALQYQLYVLECLAQEPR